MNIPFLRTEASQCPKDNKERTTQIIFKIVTVFAYKNCYVGDASQSKRGVLMRKNPIEH